MYLCVINIFYFLFPGISSEVAVGLSLDSPAGFRAHGCQVCGRFFQSKAHLTRHARRHTGERPFTCPGCHRSFSHKHNMKIHFNNLHPELADTYPDLQYKPI